MELDPRVALRGLACRAFDVQVAAHVAAGDPAKPEQAEHHVGEVLAHPGADLQEVLGGRVVGGDVLPVLEALLDIGPERQHVLADRRGRREPDRPVRAAQRWCELHGPAELEKVAQGIGRRVGRGPLGQRADGHARRTGLDQRARRHRDPVVEFRDREVMGEVVVPVAVAVHAGRRADRQLERRDGLLGRRLRLHVELEERLADERVVLERQAVLDLKMHQVTKYWVAIASWVLPSSPTTRSKRPAKSPRRICASSS